MLTLHTPWIGSLSGPGTGSSEAGVASAKRAASAPLANRHNPIATAVIVNVILNRSILFVTSLVRAATLAEPTPAIAAPLAANRLAA
jgi:hypothetical protein